MFSAKVNVLSKPFNSNDSKKPSINDVISAMNACTGFNSRKAFIHLLIPLAIA